MQRLLPGLLLFVVAVSAAEPPAWAPAKLRAAQPLLRPLFVTLAKPGPGDWLANHEEPGQTFDQYLRSKPSLPAGARKTICVQPLGEFSAGQQKILAQTTKFLGLFYNLPAAARDALPSTVVPDTARRVHPTWGDKQILTTYVLQDVLGPRLPGDAAVYLAFTASDLWPGEGWNFVFGQASLRQRVGVWSLYRFGDPEHSDAARLLCLRRTLKVAVHETGHMFSILHCTAYQCGMCGSNHLQETDNSPIHFCPECLAKVCWATRNDPVHWYETLAAFYDEAGLQDEAEFCRKALAILKEPRWPERTPEANAGK